MSEPLFRTDPYRREAAARVSAQADGGIIVNAPLFYPTGGGQPGDSGYLDWPGGTCRIETAQKAAEGGVVLIPAEGARLPPAGAEVVQRLDWDRRYGHMRVHTALHLLSVVLPLPVTGGAISQYKGRLDFDMATPPEDKAALEAALNALVARDLSVHEEWIAEDDLDANPGLVKTLSVQPPRGAGRIRLIAIGDGEDRVDLQPCGGTHIAATGEIGLLRVGKIEKKGAQNRRVYLHLSE